MLCLWTVRLLRETGPVNSRQHPISSINHDSICFLIQPSTHIPVIHPALVAGELARLRYIFFNMVRNVNTHGPTPRHLHCRCLDHQQQKIRVVFFLFLLTNFIYKHLA